MKKSLKQDIAQWMRKLSDVVWFLGDHAFVATLALVLGAGVLAGALFYQYVIFSPQIQERTITSEFQFQEETLEKLLLKLEQEKSRIKQADFLTPRDIFNP
ncbi:hypothetical protein IIB49_01075 [Patescibacteria group bacterium]|nr:hypothetical protein [Patescibacteria group bacterium]